MEISDYVSITPSIIQQFYLKPEWGLKSWISHIYYIPSKGNFFTKLGNYLHNKHGYNNMKRFFKTKVMDIDNNEYIVVFEGTPDKINPLKELKTCSRTDKNLKKKIEAATIQLYGYIWLTDSEDGTVVFIDRKTEEIIDDILVPRDDDTFFEYVHKFFDYVLSIKNLDNFNQNLFKSNQHQKDTTKKEGEKNE